MRLKRKEEVLSSYSRSVFLPGDMFHRKRGDLMVVIASRDESVLFQNWRLFQQAAMFPGTPSLCSSTRTTPNNII
jgi:hypothetical protein